MQQRLFLFSFLLFFAFTAIAQSPLVEVSNSIRLIKNDSVHIYYNEQYFLTGDSCAAIIRHGHYDSRTQKFRGPFKDVSKQDPKQLVAKGTYNADGLKEGEFIMYYLNGALQARGNFKNDLFTDVWDLYYPNGKPKLTFEIAGKDFKIINAWDEDGSRRIENEKGNYELVIGPVTWKGKINNGKQDGKWTARRTAFRQEEILATEHFKNGLFHQGSNTMGIYKNASNIDLFQSVLLPILMADHTAFTNAPCNHNAIKKVANAYYPKGQQQFIIDIGERLTPALNNLQICNYNEPLELQVTIQDDGRLVFDPTNGTDPKIVAACKVALHAMPKFIPARINDYPAQQGMLISIKYNMSVYQFGFKLLPVKETNK